MKVIRIILYTFIFNEYPYKRIGYGNGYEIQGSLWD